jgi:hypothetical protein
MSAWVKVDIPTASGNVRFTTESGHVQGNSVCPLRANSRHLQGTSFALYLGIPSVLVRTGAVGAIRDRRH